MYILYQVLIGYCPNVHTVPCCHQQSQEKVDDDSFASFLHVALPKRPINQFRPMQEIRQPVLRGYCPNLYTVSGEELTVLLFILCLVVINKARRKLMTIHLSVWCMLHCPNAPSTSYCPNVYTVSAANRLLS